MLADRLSKFARNVIVLRGGMGARQSRATAQSLAAIPDNEERVLVATGRYLGEGFDDARLDTLFLTLPISWRGTLAQYAGRLHRLHATKREVIIYDYVDGNEPMLVKMAAKREAGYRSLGYHVVDEAELGLREPPKGHGPQHSFPPRSGCKERFLSQALTLRSPKFRRSGGRRPRHVLERSARRDCATD
jgi:superfamily II DNA or RNA helicase